MKKLLFGLLLMCFVTVAANAQEHKTKTETSKTKSKPTTTVPQKVHNVIHPHKKHYSGHKYKHKKEKG